MHLLTDCSMMISPQSSKQIVSYSQRHALYTTNCVCGWVGWKGRGGGGGELKLNR